MRRARAWRTGLWAAGLLACLGVLFAARALASQATSASARDIAIRAFAYGPPELRVAVGDTVVWRNHDAVPHTATGDAWDTGEIAAEGSGRFVAKRAGRYAYFCRYHPAMKGAITVARAAGGS